MPGATRPMTCPGPGMSLVSAVRKSLLQFSGVLVVLILVVMLLL